LFDYVLFGIRPSKQDVYNTALQLYGTDFNAYTERSSLYKLSSKICSRLMRNSVEKNGDFAQSTPWQQQDNIPDRLTVVLVDHTMVAEAEDVVDDFIIAHLVLLLLLLRIPIPQLCAINVVSPAILRLSALLILAPPPARPQQQRPRSAPPAHPAQPSARGHVAFAQEGDTGNALVCLARSIYIDPTVVAKAMSARRLLDYNLNPTLQ
jgi:hypothetical protein